MQTYFRRGAVLAVPFLLLVFFPGCGPDKEKQQATIDSLRSELTTVRDSLDFLGPRVKILTPLALPPGQHKKVNANKPGKNWVQVCVKAKFGDPDIDSVMVRVNFVK